MEQKYSRVYGIPLPNRREIIKLLNIDQMIDEYDYPTLKVRKESRYEREDNKQSIKTVKKAAVLSAHRSLQAVKSTMKEGRTQSEHLLKKRNLRQQKGKGCTRLFPDESVYIKRISSVRFPKTLNVSVSKLGKGESCYKISRKITDEDRQHQELQQIASLIVSSPPQKMKPSQQARVDISLLSPNETILTELRIDQAPRILKRRNLLLKDRYQLIKLIGKGLSGQVYKAKDVLACRDVAIKVMQLTESQVEYKFLKELSHPNIVLYYNNFTEKKKRYFVLEYFEHTLASKLEVIGQTQIECIFSSITNAILYLHGLGIAHRDIKLENIVVSQNLKIVKLIDFGLSTNCGQQSSDFCGSIHYMPLEVLRRQSYDAKKVDIWALGIVLYALCFKRFPFRGKDQRQMTNRIEHTRLAFPNKFSESLKSLILRMLAHEPGKRPSIEQVLSHPW